jgi:hypothetical protein
MLETLEGTGMLRQPDHPAEQWRVRYRFDIRTRVVELPGHPAIGAKRSARGTVTSLDNVSTPEGVYRLTAEDGEELRVQNLGLAGWAILSPG